MPEDKDHNKKAAGSSEKRVVGRPFKKGQSGNPKGRQEGSINKKQAVSALLRRSMAEFMYDGTLSKTEIQQLQAKYPHITNGVDLSKEIFVAMVDRQILKAIGENDTAAFAKVMDMLGKDVDITSNGETINRETQEDRMVELLDKMKELRESTTKTKKSKQKSE